MPKLKPETHTARRDHILDAAERCFAEAGFHRSTMNDICRRASVSPGALYVYFDSKEALIAGLAERDRAEFAEQLSLVERAPDVLAAFSAMGDFYLNPDRTYKCRLGVEIGLEATRNPKIGEIFWRFDREVRQSLERLFQRLSDEGRIAPALAIDAVTSAFMVIADGIFWRHTVHPHAFTAEAAMPVALELIRQLLNPAQPLMPAAGRNPDQADSTFPLVGDRK